MPNNYGIPDAGSTIGSTPSFADAVTGLSGQGGITSINGLQGTGAVNDLLFDKPTKQFTLPDGKGGRRPLNSKDELNPQLAPYAIGGRIQQHHQKLVEEEEKGRQIQAGSKAQAAIKRRELDQRDTELGITDRANTLDYEASIHSTNTQAGTAQAGFASAERINTQRSNVDLYRSNLEHERLGDRNDLDADKMAIEAHHWQQQHNLDRRNSQRAAILNSLTQIASGFARV